MTTSQQEKTSQHEDKEYFLFQNTDSIHVSNDDGITIKTTINAYSVSKLYSVIHLAVQDATNLYIDEISNIFKIFLPLTKEQKQVLSVRFHNEINKRFFNPQFSFIEKMFKEMIGFELVVTTCLIHGTMSTKVDVKIRRGEEISYEEVAHDFVKNLDVKTIVKKVANGMAQNMLKDPIYVTTINFNTKVDGVIHAGNRTI